MEETPPAPGGLPATSPPDINAASADAITDVRAQMSVLRSQIDALRAASERHDPPWYRQASVLISIIALILSLGTSYYASEQTVQQNERAARTELGQLIQRLSALPKENADLAAKYAHDPGTLVAFQSLVASEHLVLAQQAADVIDRIPDQVSATEYLTVADALSSRYRQRSQVLVDRGLQVSSDLYTREGLLRVRGRLFFDRGDLVNGRSSMQQALDTWRDQPAQEQAAAHAYTEIIWSNVERRARQCREADAHLSRARAAIERLSLSSLRDQLTEQVDAAATQPCN